MTELKKKSAKSAKNKAKCSKKNKTWSEEELTTFAHVLASNEERDKPWALGNDGVKKELERKGIWKDSCSRKSSTIFAQQTFSSGEKFAIHEQRGGHFAFTTQLEPSASSLCAQMY